MLIVIAIIAAIHIFEWAMFGSTIQYREIEYSSSSVPAELDGTVIALVTDTHDIAQMKLSQVVERANARNIDILLFGGDFMTRKTNSDLDTKMSILGSINAPAGIYGVEGNHDNWGYIKPLMEQYGIIPLENTGISPMSGIYIGGARDLWSGMANPQQSIENHEPDDFVLLLAHNPDTAMDCDMTDIDLVCSGHTHGGQVSFFGLFAPAIYKVTNYGHLFKGGLVKTVGGTDVLVCKGTGNFSIVPRVFAPPEVYFITLKSA